MQSPNRSGNYEDEDAVRSYLETYWNWFMTDLEKKCFNLGIRRAKALLAPESGWSQRVGAEWARADEEVRAMLEDGLEPFKRRIRDRILGAFRDGALVVNRCPRCHRVVRTPLARQCLLCSFDWHG